MDLSRILLMSCVAGVLFAVDSSDFFDEEIENILNELQFHENVKNELKDHIKKHGVEGLMEKIQEKVDQFKRQKIKLAVTGESGSGKSSLINGLMGLKAGEIGSANVGVIETTKNIHSYSHPKVPNYVLFDLPGVNTPNFPKETYIDTISLDQYDCVIICSQSRFSQNDLWLAEQAQQRNIPFVFVRTKINLDIDSSQEDEGDAFNEKNTLSKIRNDIKGHLFMAVYLISSRLHHLSKWEFPDLIDHLMKNLPKEAETSFVLSLVSFSSDVIDKKHAFFKKRIPSIATNAALYEALLGCGFTQDQLTHEIDFYEAQFGVPRHRITIEFDKDISCNVMLKLGIYVGMAYLLGPVAGLIGYGLHSASYYAFSKEPYERMLVKYLDTFAELAKSDISQQMLLE